VPTILIFTFDVIIVQFMPTPQSIYILEKVSVAQHDSWLFISQE